MYNHLIYFKVEQKNFEKVHRDVQTTLVFVISKSLKNRYQNDHDFLSFKNITIETRRGCISFPLKFDLKNTSNQSQFFAHRNYVEQSTSKHLHGRSDLDFVRWFFIDFSSIKISLKKYVEITWKFADFFFLLYRHKIDIESTLIRRGVLFGRFLLLFVFVFGLYCVWIDICKIYRDYELFRLI